VKVRIHCEVFRHFDAKRLALGVLYEDPAASREELKALRYYVSHEEILDTTGNRVWTIAPVRKNRKGGRNVSH
jgi:hypothetical protein